MPPTNTGQTNTHTYAQTHSPTVNADHHDAWHVEANAAGHHRIGGRQVQSARLVHFAVVLEGHRRFGSVQSERDGHERHQTGQQPNGDDGTDCHAPRHPPAVPVSIGWMAADIEKKEIEKTGYYEM